MNISLSNIKVGPRLAAGFGLLVFLMLAITALGISRLYTVNSATDLIVRDRFPKVAMAHEVLEGINDTAIRMRNLLLIDDAAGRKQEIDRILDTRGKVEGHLNELGRILSTPKGKEIYKGIEEARQQYRVKQQKFLDLVAAGQKEEATRWLLDEVIREQEAYFAKVEGLVSLGAKLMDASGKEAQAQYETGAALMGGMAALAVLLASLLAWRVTLSITRPLREAVEVARTVASGDLTSRIEVKSRDETGELMRSLKDINDSLVRIVSEVRAGTGLIATASAEIASGNLDLSSRTEQQAGSLEETASSMEELTSTVKQNADNAQEANRLAQSATDVAVRGGTVVSQVVDTMGAINDASRKIVDIISVIDGIAFQTNILALNAAVEAARAGEQGRGFAVVAGEVRTLAQRSANAAREIKALINDSVEKIDDGSRLVNEAGGTMQEIVDSVRRVTDIMAEITAASREQASGIEQINQAITQMDQVTQQNASLVEEAAAAAESLNDQAGKLNEQVSVFRLSSAAAASMPAVRSAQPVRAPAPAPAPVRNAKATAATRTGAALALAGARPQPVVDNDEWTQF